MISKDKFCDYISEIQRLNIIEDKLQQATADLDFFKFSFCDYESLTVSILEDIFNDTKNGWISYWIYELNYGKDYCEGCVISKEGSIIKLKTAENLYDLLMDNINE